MFLETVCVNRKLKFSVPRAGREIPSIFCSTKGPTMVFVLVPDEMDCHGQPNLTSGRCTLMPTRWSAADSAVSTAQAAARRKISPTTTRMAAHLAQRGTCGKNSRDQRRGGRGWYRGGWGSGCGPVNGWVWDEGYPGSYPGGYCGGYARSAVSRGGVRWITMRTTAAYLRFLSVI